jgi:hypothetical protein
MTELKGKDKLNKAISKELAPFGISSAIFLTSTHIILMMKV